MTGEPSPWQSHQLERAVVTPVRGSLASRRAAQAAARRVAAWALVLSSVAVLALGCHVQGERLRRGSRLAEALSLLLAGDRATALRLLPAASAGCGGALRALAAGDAVVDLGVCRARRLRSLPWPLLVHRLLHDGRARQALHALDLVRGPGASQPLRNLEERARAEIAATHGGALRRVYDRMGRPLGALEHGGLVLSPAARAIGLGDWLPAFLADSPVTAGVRLSLDLELSQALQRALGREHGSVVVLDLVHGGVVAATSDPRTLEQGPAFLDQAREPASIAKLITTAAALRAGLDLDAELADFRCTGSVALSDGALYCPAVLGRVRGLDRALASSCNTTFATLGLRLGRELLVAEYQRFGFLLDFEPSLVPGARLRAPITTDRELAELAIGLNHAELTPLHAARMAALLGTGEWLPLRFVLASDGLAGRSPRFLPAAAGTRVLEPAVVDRLGRALLLVTRSGTLAGAAPASYPVAMKTGTASEPEHGFHVNYIGYAPWPQPKLAFALRLTDRGTSRAVRRAALPVTERVLRVLEQRDEEPLALRYGRGLVAGG